MDTCKKKVDVDERKFGHRLRRLIEARGIAISDFADRYGLSRSQLHNWLNRDSAPLAKHWPKLADFFGVAENYIGTGSTQILDTGPSPKTALGEEHGIYHSAPSVSGDAIRAHVERLLAAAGDDPNRLGWIHEEMLRRLAIPEHWTRPGPLVPVSLPSQTQLLSSKDMKPIPAPARRARSA